MTTYTAYFRTDAEYAVERTEAASCDFTDDEMSWLEDARRAIAKAKGGAP